MTEPANSVILERLNNLIESNGQAHKDVNNHLKELNHQVARHSEWMAKYGDEVPNNTKARRNLKLYWLTGVLAAGGIGGAAGNELWGLVTSLFLSIS